MKTPAVAQRVILSMVLMLAVVPAGGGLAAQSRTKDRVCKRTHRTFAAQTGRDQVTPSWDEVPGPTEYRIYLPDPPAPGSRKSLNAVPGGLDGSGSRNDTRIL